MLGENERMRIPLVESGLDMKSYFVKASQTIRQAILVADAHT